MASPQTSAESTGRATKLAVTRAENETCAESSGDERDSIALAVNRVLGRKGKVVGDRYHARPLTTPRQMRTSMVYVLLNFRKHLRGPACIDPRSSGQHFSGWQATPVATNVAPARFQPDTWMARVGWRLAGGPLRVDEHPAAPSRPPNLNPRMLRTSRRAETVSLERCRECRPSRNAGRSTGCDE
jgi:hypothetical protein